MPELEKIGKVLDNKIKGLTESGKKIFTDENVKTPSILEQLTAEQNNLFIELGRAVYENEKVEEQSAYRLFFEKIQNKQQLIDAEMLKAQVRRCQKCGASLSPNAMFCQKCGEKVQEDLGQCPNCGAQIKAGSKFCVKCGASLS